MNDNKFNNKMQLISSEEDSSLADSFRIIPTEILNSEEFSSAEKSILFFAYMIEINSKVKTIHLDKRWRTGRKNDNASSSISRQLLKHLKSLESKGCLSLQYDGCKLSHINLDMDYFKNSKTINVPQTLTIDFSTPLKELLIVATQMMLGEKRINHYVTLEKSTNYCQDTLRKYLRNSKNFKSEKKKFCGIIAPNYRLVQSLANRAPQSQNYHFYRDRLKSSCYSQLAVEESVNLSLIYLYDNKINYYYEKDINKRIKRKYISNLNHVQVQHEKVKGKRTYSYFNKYMENIQLTCIDGEIFIDGNRKEYYQKTFMSLDCLEVLDKKKNWINELLENKLFNKIISVFGANKFISIVRGRLRAIYSRHRGNILFDNQGSFEAFVYKMMQKQAKKVSDARERRELAKQQESERQEDKNYEFRAEISKNINDLKESDHLKGFRRSLFNELDFLYHHWIHECDITIDNKYITFVAKRAFQHEWINNNYRCLIKKVIKSYFKFDEFELEVLLKTNLD
jgi:hypothetical protein